MLLRARTFLAASIVLLAGCSGGGDDPPIPPSLIHLPSSVLDGKVIANYQGWFGCPGDFEGNVSWFHWFYGGASVDHLTVDMLPTLPTQEGVPVGAVMVSLNQDGCALAPDHYLRALQGAAETMRR